jgi:amino acid adenylation domain-containing protein
MLTESQRAAVTARLRRSRGTEAAVRIPRRPADLAELPASHGQEQLWFLDQLAPSQCNYHLAVAVSLRGPLDPGALSRAVDGLVARHEALRTRLVAGPDGRPRQLIDPPPAGLTTVLDYRDGGRDVAGERLRRLGLAELSRPFDLAAGPLLRVHLARLGAEEHVLLCLVHHTVFDGWSNGVLLRDLAALYTAALERPASGPAAPDQAGPAPELAELPVQFADYAVWERGWLTGPALTELEDYWRAKLQGLSVVPFPTDRPRPVVERFEGALTGRLATGGLLAGLRELSQREGTTLFGTLMAGLQALLSRYTGHHDITVGTVSADRARPGLAPIIGFLVNTLPIRGDLAGDPPFTQVLARMQDTVVAAYNHQRLPFGKLVEAIGAERDPGRAPVFQIMLSYAERDTAEVTASGVRFALTDLLLGDDAPAKFDLDILAEARPDGLWLECSYKTALFDPGTIERLLAHFEVLLRGVVANPGAQLSELPVLTEPEWRRELTEWNPPGPAAPQSCVHWEFEAQVARDGAAIAVEYPGELVSYAELDRRANQVGRRLRAAGIGPEDLVGVCLPPVPQRLAALLGIWKAGGGYVPLDPALPADRLAFLMADTGMTAVLTDADGRERLPAGPATVVALDAEQAAISALDDGPLDGPGADPDNVAYVIYTSGSTGQPKGVVVEHRQAVSFVRAEIGYWDSGPAEVMLGFASLSFDGSVQEMFQPLLSGGRLLLVPAEVRHSPPRLAQLMRTSGVTFACLTPSVASLLAGEQFPSLRVLMCGGEELPAELAARWLRPGLRLANDYGPTEATVSAVMMELGEDTPMPPPIGWPLPGGQAYVLDERLNPVPTGATGELHLGGARVARGYLNRPELTRERFIPDPFRPGPGARLYKTGDLVRRRPDGAIVFAGRIDNQVKIRGLRIELGEIEAALADHPAVDQAFVTVVPGPAGEKQLAAYTRPGPPAGPGPAELRAHLARTLPGYMIPAHLIGVAEFPLSTSGKIDRAALPEPGATPAGPVLDGLGPEDPGLAAPASYTESVLAGLYAAVLGRPQVGVTENFFDVGGSSLAVMRLIDAISKETGVTLGVTSIFLHPTPRELAVAVDAAASGAAAPGAGPLVTLSPGLGELPVYLIHAVGGTVFAYAQLARELSGTFGVQGLEAPGLSDPAAVPGSLDELADDYTARIRAAQPAGPYRLGGWSMGGVVAFEVARRLEQAGQQVAMLVLLDAPFALTDAQLPGDAELAGQFLTDAARSLGWDLAGLPDPVTTAAAAQLAWLAGRLGAPAAAGPDPVTERIRRQFGVFRAHTAMLDGYRPAQPAVQAPALIVSADRSPNAPARDRWPQVLAGPVSVLAIDSDHYEFLRPPASAEVAAAIRKWHDGQNGIVT